VELGGGEVEERMLGEKKEDGRRRGMNEQRGKLRKKVEQKVMRGEMRNVGEKRGEEG
jgi:hypothetical protein